MDKYTATEVAYKNGYEAGYKKAIKENHNLVAHWEIDEDGDEYCSNCGQYMPDSLPKAVAICSIEVDYCFSCGAKIVSKES